jgi:hypothetical protein
LLISPNTVERKSESFSGIKTRQNEAPGTDSRGFKDSFSVYPNDYRFMGEGAKSPARPPMTADPNATMTSGVDWPAIARAMVPTTLDTTVKPSTATTMRYNHLSFCVWLFIATSFATLIGYLYKRGFGRFSSTHIKIKTASGEDARGCCELTN